MTEASVLRVVVDRDPRPIANNLMEVQVGLDVGADRPWLRKSHALRLDIRVLMPPAWDLMELGPRSEIDPWTYFHGADLALPHDARARKDAFLANLIRLGHRDVDTYRAVDDALRWGRGTGTTSTTLPAATAQNAPIRVAPIKLFHALRAIAMTEPLDLEGRDRLDLVVDKAVIAAILPVLAARLRASDLDAAAFERDPTTFDTKALEVLDPRSFDRPTAPAEHFQPAEAYLIELTAEEWQALVRELSDDETRSPQALIVPLEVLDQVLSAHLQRATAAFWANGAVNPLRAIIESQSGRSDPWKERRADHAFFYPLVDQFLERRGEREGLRLLKASYAPAARLPPLPYIEEIDVRGPEWARRATLVSSELFAAGNRYRHAKALIEAAVKAPDAKNDLDARVAELRRSTAAWHEARRTLEELKDEAAERGYNLTAQPEIDPVVSESLGAFYKLTRTQTETRLVTEARTRLEQYTERYQVRSCSRFLFWESCNTVYRERTMTRPVTWYETRVQVETKEVPVDIDYAPIATYLRSRIPPASLPAESAKREKLARDLGVSNLDSEEAKNAKKTIRTFTYAEGVYRDATGATIDEALRQVDGDSARALFLVPIVRRTADGQCEPLKYVAVHNPVLGRGSATAPRISLVETYRHETVQFPSHHLGPLSHTLCLFPGETRRLKLAAEHRSSRSLRQDQRSSTTQSRTERASLRDQVRSAFEDESRAASSTRWNVQGSGGFSMGPFSAAVSAGGGGDTSRSSRQLASRLNDQIREISDEVSQRNEVQFSVSTESTESHVTSSEQIVEFRNMNTGRAVTYKFFQLLHRFQSNVYLDDVRIVVEYADELIPGVPIARSTSYALSEIERILPDLVEEERARLIAAIRERLTARYGTVTPLEPGGGVEVRRAPLSTEEFFVNSGAFHVDSEVGLLPATEGYVEQLRDAELAAAAARTSRISAEADAIRAGHLVVPDATRSFTLASGADVRAMISPSMSEEPNAGSTVVP